MEEESNAQLEDQASTIEQLREQLAAKDGGATSAMSELRDQITSNDDLSEDCIDRMDDSNQEDLN